MTLPVLGVPGMPGPCSHSIVGLSNNPIACGMGEIRILHDHAGGLPALAYWSQLLS